MIDRPLTLRGFMASHNSSNASSSNQQTQSPSPESGIAGLSDYPHSLKTLKFDLGLDHDAEVQSIESSIWESLFSDNSTATTDFMVSSPRRDINHMMVFSPRRNYGVGVSSPRNRIVSSPKRGGIINFSHTQPSPLQKAASSPKFPLALPALDAFFGDSTSMSRGDEGSPAESFEEASRELPNLPVSRERYCAPVGMNYFEMGMLQQRRDEEEEEEQTRAAKSELMLMDHGLLGPLLPMEPEVQEQDTGLQLVHLLLACAEATANDDHLSARRHLQHLNRVVSPLGDSIQRVAAYFVDALAARLSSLSTRNLPAFPPPIFELLKAYQILYHACPYIKFAHFAANQTILEAFHYEDHVHIIDLDILQGYQWPSFIHALASRPGGAPSLRITGISPDSDVANETGRQLSNLAHTLNIQFVFHIITASRLEDIKPHMLNRRVGEALAVNSVCRLHRVGPSHVGSFLGMIRDQAPNIVTVVEEEASHNGTQFLGRFLEALHYYSAMFDSLDATFPPDSEGRAMVERCLFGPEIGNVVALEGVERVARHERVERWRRVMEGRGFKGVPLSANTVAQSEMLLGMYPCEGYRMREDEGCLILGWQDRPLITASAWRC